jgi:maleylpyruvate isomerase
MPPACHAFGTVAFVSDDSFDPLQVAADIESCMASHAALSAWLRGSAPLDPTQPSGLPDWTLGHVLTHIARNADSHLSALDGLPQYPHGLEGRNRDIESGASRSWAELVDDVAATSAALDERWAAHDDWSGNSMMLMGERPTHLLPLVRQREVEVHRADLGVGYGFADMPSEYIQRDLLVMGTLWQGAQRIGEALPSLSAELPQIDTGEVSGMKRSGATYPLTLQARQPMAMATLPDSVLAADPPTRLAWLMGRAVIDGLDPAGLV